MPKSTSKPAKSKDKSPGTSKKTTDKDKTNKKGKSDATSKSSGKTKDSKPNKDEGTKPADLEPTTIQPIAQIVRYCVAHKLKLEYYCETCEEPICSLCITLGPHNNQVCISKNLVY